MVTAFASLPDNFNGGMLGVPFHGLTALPVITAVDRDGPRAEVVASPTETAVQILALERVVAAQPADIAGTAEHLEQAVVVLEVAALDSYRVTGFDLDAVLVQHEDHPFFEAFITAGSVKTLQYVLCSITRDFTGF